MKKSAISLFLALIAALFVTGCSLSGIPGGDSQNTAASSIATATTPGQPDAGDNPGAVDTSEPIADNEVTSDTENRYGWTRTLQQGMSGADVKELQIRVAGWAADAPAQGYVAIDGSFGAGTAAAVRRFQKAYGLTADGVAGPNTQSKLNSLQDSDGSTVHFNFSEFMSKDGAGFSGGSIGSSTVKENVRRNMYKLEALRVKCGNNAVTVNSGFRSIAHNKNGDEPQVMEEMLADRAVGGEGNSQHTYGIASDIVIANRTVSQVIYQAKTCGYSGIIRYATFTHVDSRLEYAYGAQFWYWAD